MLLTEQRGLVLEKIKFRKYFKNHCNNFILNNNIQVLSQQVQSFIGTLDWPHFQTVALYNPFNDEVPLFILKDKYPNIRWLYPKEPDKFYEVLNGLECPIEDIDVFFVPGMAFDHQCRRLGRGLGFYDRVLSQNNRALKVGVSWSVQVSSEPLPEEKHDIRMDACVNEKFLLCSPHFFEKCRKDL